MNICKCDNEIHPKRVEFLQKRNMPIMCLDCVEGKVQKLGGFMNVEGKTERTIVIAPMEIIEQLHQVSARAGTGVSKGVKMNQSFKSKIFK